MLYLAKGVQATTAIEGNTLSQLDAQIKQIQKYQRAVIWKDFVYERFRGLKTTAAHRQRMLALVLGTKSDPVAISAIPLLSPEIALEYAGKTRKTLVRDVNELERKELALRSAKGVIANQRKLQAFLPKCRDKSKWI